MRLEDLSPDIVFSVLIFVSCFMAGMELNRWWEGWMADRGRRRRGGSKRDFP